MNVDNKLEALIRDHHDVKCCTGQAGQARDIANTLLETLRDTQVVSFIYAGEHRLNPVSTWTRPMYEVTHAAGRALRLAFTGMGTIQVFSKRKRSTHCYAAEFRKRMRQFLFPTPPTSQA